MRYIFSTHLQDTKRYCFPAHINDLVLDKAAATSEVFIVVLDEGAHRGDVQRERVGFSAGIG